MKEPGLSIAPLLLHTDGVPAGVRDALRNAFASDHHAEREAHLFSAAQVFARETDLECVDIKELVGLGSDASCG
jgi:hypothetical protein